MTFGRYFEERFWPSEELRRSTKTQQENLYRSHVKPTWGETRLCDIDIDAVKAWRVSLKTRRWAPVLDKDGNVKHHPDKIISDSTQRQVYWLFHKTIAAANESGYIRRSPLPRKSGLPQSQPTKPIRALLPQEIEMLAKTAGDHATLVWTLAYGGFRIGEALALREHDIDFTDGYVIVDEKLAEVAGVLEFEHLLKRTRSHRVVPMPQDVLDMIKDRLTGEPDGLLFTDSDGGPIRLTNWRRYTFDRALKKSGLEKLTPHDLRHTAASAWFDEGFDIVQVARFLGETVASAERTYVHIYKGAGAEKIDKINDRIRRGREATSNVVPLRAMR